MTGKHKFTKAYRGLDIQKADEITPIPGILGFIIDGVNTVEIANRPGYVYVRLRDNLSEVCQAFNDNVSPVYGLPVLIVRDSTNPTRYKVLSRDLGRYQSWGTSSPYLPRHGTQHSFNPPLEGGDITWIYSRQLMPLLVYPSGSYGSANALVYPYTFYRNNLWQYAGGTGTASFLPYKPTGSANAKMVLVYIDGNNNPTLVAGSEFSATLTGTVQVYPYIPSIPITDGIPLAGIRLVTGTSVILWDNIYDLRPWIVGDGFLPTGTVGHIIADEGVNQPTQAILDFIGPGVGVRNGSGRTEVIISGTATGGAGSVTIANNQIGFGSGTSIIGDPGFLWYPSEHKMVIDAYDYYPMFYIMSAEGTKTNPSPVLAAGNLFDISVDGYYTGTAVDGSYDSGWTPAFELEITSLNTFSSSSGIFNATTAALFFFGVSGTLYGGTQPGLLLGYYEANFAGNLNTSGTVRPGSLQLRYFTFSGSNPPTDAQLDSNVGTPASVGKGFTAYWNNNNAGTDVYLLSSDGTNWWYQAMTKAV